MSDRIAKFTVTVGPMKTRELNVSLDAFRRVSKVFGGLVPAYNKVTSLDQESFAQILLLGSDLSPSDMEKSQPEYERDLFETGMIDLQRPLLDYLNLLASGGRQAKPPEAEK